MGILGSTDTDYIFVKIYRYRSPIRYWSCICQTMIAYIYHAYSYMIYRSYHVAKLPQHFLVVNYGKIYNCYTEKYLKKLNLQQAQINLV